MNYDKRISVGTAQPVYEGTLTIAYGSTERRATGGGWVADTESANQKGNMEITSQFIPKIKTRQKLSVESANRK